MFDKLKEVLGFTDVFFISLGYIIGAGIFSLIYLITRYGRELTWVSFVIGGILSLLTALSYSDLSAYFDTTASDYDYLTATIAKNFKFLTATVLIFFGILAATTLCLAFSNIIKKMFKNVSYNLILILVILIPTIINIYDVKATSNINMGISIVGVLTLIFLIVLGLGTSSKEELLLPIKSLKNLYSSSNSKISVTGILHGAFLSLFAYSGFETIPKLADETKDSRKTIPIAMVSSLILTIVLYILVSISINSVLGVNKVTNTVNPITDAFVKLLGVKSQNTVNIITLSQIFNSLLLILLFASRQLYGVAQRKVYPKIFTSVNAKTNTPIYAILFISVVAFILCFIKDINITSHMSNILMVLVFIGINLSAVILAYKGKMSVNGLFFDKEANLNKNKKKGQISWYSLFGFISSIVIFYKTLRSIF